MPNQGSNGGAFPARLFVFAFLGWTFDFYDLVLALLTASWVWVLPETRGIRLPVLRDIG